MNGGCSVSTFDAPCHSTLFLVGHIFRPLSFWFSQIFIWVIVSPMENKRDATSVGLGWPLTSNRGTHSTLVPDASTIDASTNPTSTPSASLEPMSTSSDLAQPSSTCSSFPDTRSSTFQCSPPCTLYRTSGSSDSLQDLYTLQQRTWAIYWGDTNFGNF